MFIKIESKVKEPIAEIAKKYDGAICIIKVDHIEDTEGYLLVVSTSRESYTELIEYIKAMPEVNNLVFKGSYREEGVAYVRSSFTI